jgi:hypothetical protein
MIDTDVALPSSFLFGRVRLFLQIKLFLFVQLIILFVFGYLLRSYLKPSSPFDNFSFTINIIMFVLHISGCILIIFEVGKNYMKAVFAYQITTCMFFFPSLLSIPYALLTDSFSLAQPIFAAISRAILFIYVMMLSWGVIFGFELTIKKNKPVSRIRCQAKSLTFFF